LLKRKILLFIYRGIRKVFAGKGLKKYSFIQSINAIFKNKLFVTFVEVEGNKMHLFEKGGGDSLELSAMESYEPVETEIIKKNINKGDHVIDLGASVGYYTLLLAKLVGKNGKVYSFESNPEKISILEKNIHLNNYQNIILIQKFVSNKSTTNSGIQSIALDDYFQQSNSINLIKMDIEGAEVQAIEGMKQLLENNQNIKIITEFHTSELREEGADPKEFLNKLRQFGFSIFNINEKNKELEDVTYEDLLKNYPNKEVFTNLFCQRK
jgi:23S rRNA U2552 (ribose-2'-O)-methylase RlmE/FtsJ